MTFAAVEASVGQRGAETRARSSVIHREFRWAGCLSLRSGSRADGLVKPIERSRHAADPGSIINSTHPIRELERCGALWMING